MTTPWLISASRRNSPAVIPAYLVGTKGLARDSCPSNPGRRRRGDAVIPFEDVCTDRGCKSPRPSRCEARPTSNSTHGDIMPSPSDSPTRGCSPAFTSVDKWWGVPLVSMPIDNELLPARR